MLDWLRWLEAEMQSWIEAPHLVRMVQIILANQNEEKGYEAENALCRELISRFLTVPWRKNAYLPRMQPE